MDKELVRGIIKTLNSEKREVPGYTTEQVEKAFSRLVSEEIISVLHGEKCVVKDLEHLKGNILKQPISVVGIGEEAEICDILDEEKLKRLYGINSCGNDI